MSITEEQTVSKQSLFVRPAGGQAQKLAPIALTEPQRAATFMALSLLLDYPDEKLWSEHLAAVQAARTEFPPAIWDLLSTFIAQAQEMGNRALCEHYVETFDRRRKCCLYLSYYAVGDTRHRGAALLSFKKLFSAAGWELETSELPDYLPVVLEFCARSQDVLAQNLLVAHQDGLGYHADIGFDRSHR